MCNFWSAFLLLLAGWCLGFAFNLHQNEKGREKWEAEVFSVYVKKLIEVQTSERERYDEELAKLKKLKADRVVVNTTGYSPVIEFLEKKFHIKDATQHPLKIDYDDELLTEQAQWTRINPSITQDAIDEINRHIEKQRVSLQGKGEVIYTPPFMAPDGTWRFDIGVIPKEET